MLGKTGIAILKVEPDAIKLAVSKATGWINLFPVSGSAKAHRQHDKKIASALPLLFVNPKAFEDI